MYFAFFNVLHVRANILKEEIDIESSMVLIYLQIS